MSILRRFLIHILLFVSFRRKHYTDYNPPKNILINLISGGIGDLILLTPVLKSLRGEFREAKIEALARPRLYHIVNNMPYFDNVFLVRTEEEIGLNVLARMQVLFNLIRLIHSKNIDVMVNPIFVGNTITTILITSLWKARIKIGFNWNNSSRLYTHPIEVDRYEHDINQNLKILSILDIKPIDRKTEFIISEQASRDAQAFLIEYGITDEVRPLREDIIVGLHPVAEKMRGYNPRSWAKDKYVQVGRWLFERYNAKVIIFSGKKDVNEVQEIKENIGVKAVIQAGKTPLETAGAILKRCNLLITNDSGIMHLGYAVDIPMVAIWGPTDPRRRGYIDEKRIVVKKNLPCQPCRENPKMQNCKTLECLKQITVKEVFDASCELLDQ